MEMSIVFFHMKFGDSWQDKHLEMCKKHLPESLQVKRDVSTFLKSRH